jgi:ubiquinone/menaquinone biosynthesis C-methylase UbiE
VEREYYKGADAAVYEYAHGDIFNSIEQQRLYGMLREAVQSVQTGAKPLQALDFGCGSGNLTRHLIGLGVHTVSADVSDDFLEGIRRKFSATGLSETLRLNGTDLANVPEARFDLVAGYSVLHHVSDYLAIVREMGRVVRPGGVVYLDHEVTPDYYGRPPVYVEFLKRARPRVDWRRMLRLVLDVRGRATSMSGRMTTSSGTGSSRSCGRRASRSCSSTTIFSTKLSMTCRSTMSTKIAAPMSAC